MSVYKRGKIWWFNFSFEGRHVQESSGFTNKTAAIRAEAIRRTELLNRRAGFKKAKAIPKFEEFVEKFLDWSEQQHKPKTRALHGTNCETLLRFFKGNWLDEISMGMVGDFKIARSREGRRNTREKGSVVSPATVNRETALLKHMFNMAERWGMHHGANPVRLVKFLPENNLQYRTLSEDDERRLLEASPPYLRDLILFALNIGL